MQGMAAALFAAWGLLAWAATPKLDIRSLETPAGADSGQACFWPMDGKLGLSWIEAEGERRGALFWAAYDGRSWSEPRLIVRGDNLFINWADFPKMASAGPMTVAAWLERLGEGTYAYGVRAAVSTDGGVAWGEPFWLHQDRSPVEHGFVSLTPLASGRVAAVWLDGRAMGGGHDHGEGGPMQLRSRVIESGGLGPETLIDGQTCECCNTALALSDGALLAAYRDRSDAHVRDIFLARHERGAWQKGAAVRDDGWRIHGCPVNGPALSAAGQTVVLAWFSGAENRPRVRLAASPDGGRSFPGAIDVAAGTPMGRVDCLVDGDGLIWTTWMSMSGELKLAVHEFDEEVLSRLGGPWTARAVSADRSSGFPRLARLGGRLFLAYRDVEAKRVRVLAMRFKY